MVYIYIIFFVWCCEDNIIVDGMVYFFMVLVDSWYIDFVIVVFGRSKCFFGFFKIFKIFFEDVFEIDGDEDSDDDCGKIEDVL